MAPGINRDRGLQDRGSGQRTADSRRSRLRGRAVPVRLIAGQTHRFGDRLLLDGSIEPVLGLPVRRHEGLSANSMATRRLRFAGRPTHPSARASGLPRPRRELHRPGRAQALHGQAGPAPEQLGLRRHARPKGGVVLLPSRPWPISATTSVLGTGQKSGRGTKPRPSLGGNSRCSP